MQKRWICTLILLTFCLLASLAANAVLVATRSWTLPAMLTGRDESKTPRFDQQPLMDGSLLGGKIAVVAIRGVISDDTAGELGGSMVDDILYGLQQASEDKTVKAVILKIDSPGGEVTASDTVFNAIRATTKKKPVVACMGAMACSGAYYSAVGADYIIANEVTTTGSIGVIIQTMNYHGLLDKVGVEPVVFKSGQLKDAMSGTRPMTQIEKDYMNLMVMQTFEKFLQVVAEQRKLPKVTLREQVGDGRIISGRDALAYHLIDRTGTFADAVAKARELARADGAGVVRYVAPVNFVKALHFLNKASDTPFQMKVELGPGLNLQAGRTYLLPASMVPGGSVE